MLWRWRDDGAGEKVMEGIKSSKDEKIWSVSREGREEVGSWGREEKG